MDLTLICKDKSPGVDLYKHLRSQKKRRKSYVKQDSRGRVTNRICIKKRPTIVAPNSRIGDWKKDMITGEGR